MKKFFTLLLCIVTSMFTILGVACNDSTNPNGKITLYCPDGAPALSVARLLSDKEAISNLDVKVVSASVIQTYVTGETPTADLAIMPVNAASKLLGNANKYQMVGVVTHGNLFLMKKTSGVNITLSNLNELIGKKVGVINLGNVPGLTFKAILNDNSISYVDISESGIVQSDKVNLKGLSGGTEVIPSSDCDYFVVPEPAATTKQRATNGALSIAGSLQDLYGSSTGYPQAVLVAKKSVISENKGVIDSLISSFAQNQSWLLDSQTSMQTIVDAVVSGFIDNDMAPTFTANNLNATVIQNCAINFISATSAKTEVLDYIAKLNLISNDVWGTPVEGFFYVG